MKLKKQQALSFTNIMGEPQYGIVLEVFDEDEYTKIITDSGDYEEISFESIISKEDKETFMDIWEENGSTSIELDDIILSS